MRPACAHCARKHLAQALVLLNESRQGYPLHFWLAIGHLAEASDELIWSPDPKLRDVAARIRLERKDLELGQGHEVPILDILHDLDDAEAWTKPVERPEGVKSSGVLPAKKPVRSARRPSSKPRRTCAPKRCRLASPAATSVS